MGSLEVITTVWKKIQGQKMQAQVLWMYRMLEG